MQVSWKSVDLPWDGGVKCYIVVDWHSLARSQAWEYRASVKLEEGHGDIDEHAQRGLIGVEDTEVAIGISYLGGDKLDPCCFRT